MTDVWRRLPKTAGLFLITLLMLLAVPPSAVFVSEMIMIGFGLRDHLWPTLLVLVALTVVFVAMLRHVYALLFGEQTQTDSVPVPAEPWGAHHVIMVLHVVGAAALGVFYLTPAGLEFMVRIAQSLNPGLL